MRFLKQVLDESHSRQHDDPEFWMKLLDVRQQLKTVFIRQSDVQHDQVLPLCPRARSVSLGRGAVETL